MQFDTNLDYLTVTVGCSNEWRESVRNLLHTVELGEKRRPWRFLQYSGYSVHHIDGHCSWGAAKRGGIIQASGRLAAALAARANKWLPQEFRVTRLDFAVTFCLEGPNQLVRQLMGQERPGWRAIIPHSGEGGGTLYIGDRTSDAFGRLYDKGAHLNVDLPKDQQVPIAKLWRAEVEYKGKRARQVYDAWQAKKTVDDRRAFVCDTTLTWFQERGVFLPVICTSPSIVSVASRGIDDIRTLKWFYEQVRPALVRLVDNGKTAEVERALSLSPGTLVQESIKLTGDIALQWSYFDKEEV